MAVDIEFVKIRLGYGIVKPNSQFYYGSITMSDGMVKLMLIEPINIIQHETILSKMKELQGEKV